MLKTLLRSSVLMLLLFQPGIRPAYAQNFVPPQAFDFIFNGPNITWTEDISCYSFRNETPTAWGDVDVYLAGWGMNKGEVTVQFTRQGDPTDIKYQGTIPYVTGFNIAVGATFNQNTNAMQVLVAYERDGFKLDIYDITTSSGNPLALNTTLNLTNDPLTTFARRRIRMDSHRDWAAVIWDYPNHGIQAIGCKGGNWGNIIDVQNTYGYEGPDVAISEVNGERRLQMVYLMPPTSIIPGIIRCESLDFNTLMTSSSTATPFGGSNFHVVSTPVNWGYPNLVIDSKDYDDHENWAFVGTYPNVPLMYVSYHFDNGVYPPGNGIMAVNSGLLGNANISGMFSAVTPSIHFGGGPYGPDQVMMGWYASNNTYQGYMGLSMKPDYSGLVSDPDYLLLSNVTSPFQKMSGLAFSKEDKQLAPDHLYAVYFNRQNTTGIYELHHAFHKWDNPVFRTEQELELSTDVVYPNPFSNKIHTTLTAAEDGFVSMQLTDITGRLVAQKSYSVQKGKNACTIDGLQNLIPGTYFLKTKVNGKKATTQVVVKH